MRLTSVKTPENKEIRGVKVSLLKKKTNERILLGLKKNKPQNFMGNALLFHFSLNVCCFSLYMLRVIKLSVN